MKTLNVASALSVGLAQLLTVAATLAMQNPNVLGALNQTSPLGSFTEKSDGSSTHSQSGGGLIIIILVVTVVCLGGFFALCWWCCREPASCLSSFWESKTRVDLKSVNLRNQV